MRLEVNQIYVNFKSSDLGCSVADSPGLCGSSRSAPWGIVSNDNPKSTPTRLYRNLMRDAIQRMKAGIWPDV